MSSKRRVFQVAREFNVSIEALTIFLNELKFQVSSRMSKVTDEMYAEICKEFSQDLKVTAYDYDIKKELKEKKAVEAEKKKKELIEFEKRVEISAKVMTESIERRKKAVKMKDTKKSVTKTKSAEETVEKKQKKTIKKETSEKKEVDAAETTTVSKKQKPKIEKAPVSVAGKESDKKEVTEAKRVIHKIDDQKKLK